jgi:carbamoyltransferase
MSRWIVGINPGHNGSLCLLKDGEIVFFIEEERLSRLKYDGTPYLGMLKIKDYTDTLDCLVIGGTTPSEHKFPWTKEDIFIGMARKLGLITDPTKQILFTTNSHHRMHAACAFYRSGFDYATAVIVDGAGSILPPENEKQSILWEVESIFECSYPNNISTIFKHRIGNDPAPDMLIDDYQIDNETYTVFHSNGTGLVKCYEAVTHYCGFHSIEAGKTMGLSAYGNPNENIPPIYYGNGYKIFGNKNLFVPASPATSYLNVDAFPELEDNYDHMNDLSLLQNRRDMAYAIQKESQERSLELIIKAVEMTGCRNVIYSGGYGLNCVANYYYLDQLNKLDINLYVEPISNDAGISIGSAMIVDRHFSGDNTVLPRAKSLYLGFEYRYSIEDIEDIVSKYNGSVVSVDNFDIVDLLRKKNIVSIFQGRSEAGPRALGNRSILFDPSFEDGKDFVNQVKRREYFRPFAGSILEEYANEWFDMKGLTESPHMMYAVNCQPGKAELIPSIIHVDGSCRIQTVSEEQNPLYYKLISDFYEVSGVPILFNTSFNLAGEPLVETLDDAMRTLSESDIEYLYLPEHQKLIIIKNHGE